jgi:hypothetical protein
LAVSASPLYNIPCDRIIFELVKSDELVKSRPISFSVIPADPGLAISRAGPGIQYFQDALDPGVRRGDDVEGFLRVHHNSP